MLYIIYMLYIIVNMLYIIYMLYIYCIVKGNVYTISYIY